MNHITKGRPPKAARPSLTLPTDRVAFSKQLDILRAYAIASGPTARAVSNGEVASIVKMVPQTVAICNSFFAGSGLIERNGSGYSPSAEVISFNRAYEWTPETASHKLAPKLSAAWFSERLIGKLRFRPMDIDSAITDLAEAAAAGPDYKNQLRMVLDYMAAAGLIAINDNRVTAGKFQPPDDSAHASEPVAVAPEPEEQRERREAAPHKVSTSFMQQTEGTVQFHVSVKVNMAEMEGWKPDRIAAFFGGIAQVLAAKGAIEEGTKVND
jgi:hypothetical protein